MVSSLLASVRSTVHITRTPLRLRPRTVRLTGKGGGGVGGGDRGPDLQVRYDLIVELIIIIEVCRREAFSEGSWNKK